MKTLQEQYNLIKEGKGAKDVFLKEAKLQYPSMINNAANFTQAANILKRRSVIQENYVDLKTLLVHGKLRLNQLGNLNLILF